MLEKKLKNIKIDIKITKEKLKDYLVLTKKLIEEYLRKHIFEDIIDIRLEN